MPGRRGESVTIIVATIGQYFTIDKSNHTPAPDGGDASAATIITKEYLFTLRSCAAAHSMDSVVTLLFTSPNSSDIKVPLQYYLLSSITSCIHRIAVM